MTPVCTYCDGWIETSNRSHPGYCSPTCRDRTRATRDRATAEQAQRRADRRQQAEAHQPVKHYAT